MMDPKLSYREAAVQGASPLRLVILMYEQAIEDLRRAAAAQARGDVEGRTREINHALLVLGHLEATLDKTQGGQVALNLERFYQQIRVGLVEAQCQQSGAKIERQIAMLTDVHAAWCEVERATTSPPAEPPRPTASSDLETGQHSVSDWNA